MNIRRPTYDDLPEILRVYAAARQTMRENGNPTQWKDFWPPEDVVREDIETGLNYVLEDETGIHGVFVLLKEADPMYDVIVDGAWPNDEPYFAIHRIASDGQARGIFGAAVQFAREQATQAGIHELRIDTHANNSIMLHCIEKAGFACCGTVFNFDDTPRTAFQLSLKDYGYTGTAFQLSW